MTQLPHAAMGKKLFNRILIIDDDPASTFLAKLTIEDMEVAEEVATLHSALEALDFVCQRCMNEHAARADCPDLILLDINMPVLDGFGFLDALQQLGQHNIIHTLIVVLTSSSYPKDQQKMLTYGVRGYLTKPITEEKIMSTLPS